MFTLLLLLLAPILAFVIAFFLATLLPRVCGYLLGPAFLLSRITPIQILLVAAAIEIVVLIVIAAF